MLIGGFFYSSWFLLAEDNTPSGVHRLHIPMQKITPNKTVVNEAALEKLIDELISKGILQEKEAIIVKRKLATLSTKEWERIRKLSGKASRYVASKEGMILRREVDNSIPETPQELEDGYEKEQYKIMSEQVEGALKND